MNNVIYTKIKNVTHNTFVFFVLIYASYSLFLNQTYDPDNTASIVNGYYSNIMWSKIVQNNLLGGRVVSTFESVCNFLFNKIGINFLSNRFVLQLLLMVLLSCACAELLQLYATYYIYGKKWLYPIIAFGVISPFYVEFFAFGGMGGGLGFLLSVISVVYYSKGKYFSALLWCFLAVGTYQVNYQIVILYGIAVLFYEYEDNIARILKKVICLFAISGISAIFVLVAPRLFSMISGQKEVKESIIGAAERTPFLLQIFYVYREYINVLKHNYGLMPVYFLGLLVFILIALSLICLAYAKDKKKIVLFALFTIIIWLLPPSFAIVMATIYMPSRTLIGIFMALSVQMLMAYKCVCVCISDRKVLFYFFQGIVLIYAFVVLYSVQTMAADVLITNKMEMAQMRMMQNIIDEYEDETGNIVDTVAVTHLKNGIYAYDKSNTNMNYMGYPSTHMVINKEWCDVVFLNYVNGKNYKRADIPEEDVERFFPDLNWEDFDTFNPTKQMVFEGNVLYWAQY